MRARPALNPPVFGDPAQPQRRRRSPSTHFRDSNGSATDVELAVALGHGRPPEWQHPREHAVTEVQAGHLSEDPLWSPDHPAGPDVVGRAVPGANQAAVLIDAATRQISAEVPAPARDREVAPTGVPDGVAPSAHYLARLEIGSCANPLRAHRASFRVSGLSISTLGRIGRRGNRQRALSWAKEAAPPRQTPLPSANASWGGHVSALGSAALTVVREPAQWGISLQRPLRVTLRCRRRGQLTCDIRRSARMSAGVKRGTLASQNCTFWSPAARIWSRGEPRSSLGYFSLIWRMPRAFMPGSMIQAARAKPMSAIPSSVFSPGVS